MEAAFLTEDAAFCNADEAFSAEKAARIVKLGKRRTTKSSFDEKSSDVFMAEEVARFTTPPSPPALSPSPPSPPPDPPPPPMGNAVYLGLVEAILVFLVAALDTVEGTVIDDAVGVVVWVPLVGTVVAAGMEASGAWTQIGRQRPS